MTAKNPKQEFQNVATAVPAIQYAGRYGEKDTLYTKNESKSMSVAIFHDADVRNEARDNTRLTSKKNKGKENLHIKDKKKDTYVSRHQSQKRGKKSQAAYLARQKHRQRAPKCFQST